MSLTSANVSYPPHVRMHQHQQQLHQQQPSYSHPYPRHSDISPTMSHESVASNHSTSSAPVSPPIESPHPLYISTASHNHPQQQQQQQQQQQPSYRHGPYQAPSPPYTHPQHRSDSIDLAQKPNLPYPARHSYSTTSHRAHPYSPPTLPPLTGRAPLSPQSPIESSPHYPMLSSNRDERHHYRTESPMSASPPPSSSSANDTSMAPLSATDRRERNKAASAKYRAKKHYQSGEMRSQITVLQDHNNVITRQLEECRAENASLKNLVEKLRGRLVAEKVLKRLREVGREKKRRGSGGSGAGHSTAKVSAHDLSMSDSENDDGVDAVGEDDIDDEYDIEEEKATAEIERRQNERKMHTRRRVTRTEDDDYRGD